MVPYLPDSYMEGGDIVGVMGIDVNDIAEDEVYELIFAESAKGGVHAARVALAHALVYADDSISGRTGNRREISHAYFSFMQATGYVLTDVERALLTAEPDEDNEPIEGPTTADIEASMSRALDQEQAAATTETTEHPQASENGNAAAAPAGEPVSQHVCRQCGQRKDSWAEMVDIGWLCTDCAAGDPPAIMAEVAGPVDQRAGR